MKIFKTLSKRGLALFLVLTMCLSLLPTTAMAAELAEDHHTHNDDGWTCVEERQLVCTKEVHIHTDECYPAASDTETGDETETDANVPDTDTNTPADAETGSGEEPEQTEQTPAPLLRIPKRKRKIRTPGRSSRISSRRSLIPYLISSAFPLTRNRQRMIPFAAKRHTNTLTPATRWSGAAWLPAPV